MTKRRLPTFISKKKLVKVKLQDKVVTMKEEMILMTPFIIAFRKGPEMDLQHYLGSYDFSISPRSMFSSDGQLLLASDKAAIMHQVETLVQSLVENYQQTEGTDEEDTGNVILFDGMAVVNCLKLGLLKAFFRVIQEESSHAEKLRAKFDRYIDHSLKRITCEK